jgi:hypothetical protein
MERQTPVSRLHPPRFDSETASVRIEQSGDHAPSSVAAGRIRQFRVRVQPPAIGRAMTAAWDSHKLFLDSQCLDPNLVALRGLELPESGAGDGNRTQTDTPSKPIKRRVS